MNILRNPYSRHGTFWTLFGLAILLYILSGCVKIQVAERTEMFPHCVPQSIMAAWTAEGLGYDSRIAISSIEPGMDHAQAEALVDGEWVPLTILWDQKRGVMVTSWERHFKAVPYRYWDLDSFIVDQKQHRDHGKELARLARRRIRRDEENS